jgi:hypothetical protein
VREPFRSHWHASFPRIYCIFRIPDGVAGPSAAIRLFLGPSLQLRPGLGSTRVASLLDEMQNRFLLTVEKSVMPWQPGVY